MTRPCLASFLLLAAACGGSPARSPIANTKHLDGARCPAADRVRFAAYTSGAAGSWYEDKYGLGGEPRWRLPLAIEAADADDRAPAEPISLDAVLAAGAARPPATVTMFWRSSRGDERPCVATVGAAYRAVGDNGLPFEELGVELDGCPAPASDDDSYEAWVSLDDAPGCALVSATFVGERSWNGESWDREPSGPPSPPAELQRHVPPVPAGASPAALLWSATVARIGAHALAWDLETAQVTSPPGTAACMLESVDAIQHFSVIGSRVIPAIERDDAAGWAHLRAVLAVDGAPRVLVLAGLGAYTAIDIAPDGTPGSPHTTEYYIPHDEDHLGVELTPYCGP